MIRHISEIHLEAGKRYDVLPLHRWTERAMEAGLHPSVAMLTEEMDASSNPSYSRLLKSR